MRSLISLPLGIVLACGLATAQSFEELPKGYTNIVSQIYDYHLVPASSRIPAHLQYAYDTADVSVAGASFRELAWHRNNYWGNSMPAGSNTMTVTMSHSPNTPAAMSSTFASNLALLTKQVFTGTVNWPNVPKSTGPAPWTHKLPLTSNFIFVKSSGKSLVIDIVITATTYANSTYTIAAAAPDAGTRTSNPRAQSSCKFSNGKYNNSLSYTTGGLNNNGGTWYVSYGSILPNAPGVMTISAFGVDNKGPWPLPISLAGLGASGCSWNIGLEIGVWIPVTANASGQARVPNITIPPGLGGIAFYDHALFRDPAANSWGWVATWSSKWYIGTLKGPSSNMLYRAPDANSSPTGGFRKGYGTHVRLTR